MLIAEPAAPRERSANSAELRRIAFHALGTPCEIQYACADDARADTYALTVRQWVDAFEAKYSRFRPDSLLSRINAAAGLHWTAIDGEMEQMLDLCDSIYTTTQGLLDATMLPLLRLWDYKAELPVIPSVPAVTTARRLVGWPKVRRRPGAVFLPEAGMALDFGGFGKEYAVDVVAQIAAEHGISDVLVDFGHDICVLGRPPGRPAWRIGLEDPRRPGVSDGSVALQGSRGIASSGDYLRRFVIDGRRFGHIIDPRTGWPVGNGCLQATVIASNCLLAGILSTTAFVLGVPRGLEFIQSFPGAEGLLIDEHVRAQTRGFFNHVVAS